MQTQNRTLSLFLAISLSFALSLSLSPSLSRALSLSLFRILSFSLCVFFSLSRSFFVLCLYLSRSLFLSLSAVTHSVTRSCKHKHTSSDNFSNILETVLSKSKLVGPKCVCPGTRLQNAMQNNHPLKSQGTVNLTQFRAHNFWKKEKKFTLPNPSRE